ncbi:hypothetical protein HDV05_000187 [Chytridiales sp. JEL 0842]|nr:hypothetical protein HDV05_000187 [Chytridiales sp. JEL 0842]
MSTPSSANAKTQRPASLKSLRRCVCATAWEPAKNGLKQCLPRYIAGINVAFLSYEPYCADFAKGPVQLQGVGLLRKLTSQLTQVSTPFNQEGIAIDFISTLFMLILFVFGVSFAIFEYVKHSKPEMQMESYRKKHHYDPMVLYARELSQSKRLGFDQGQWDSPVLHQVVDEKDEQEGDGKDKVTGPEKKDFARKDSRETEVLAITFIPSVFLIAATITTYLQSRYILKRRRGGQRGTYAPLPYEPNRDLEDSSNEGLGNDISREEEEGDYETDGFSMVEGKAEMVWKALIVVAWALLLLSVVTPLLGSGYGYGESTEGLIFTFLLDVVGKSCLIYLANTARRVPTSISPHRFQHIFAGSILLLFASSWEILSANSDNPPLVPAMQLLSTTALCSMSGYLTYIIAVSSSPKSGVEHGEGSRKLTLEASAGILSRITFQWMEELILLSVQRQLTADDLWELDTQDRGHVIYAQFERVFGLIDTDSYSAEVKGKPQNRLLKAIIKVIWKLLAVEYCISILNHVFLFTTPLMIHATLSTIQNPSASQWDILMPVLGLFVASLARTACESQLYWVNRRIDAHVRACLVGCVYAKSMTRMQPNNTQTETSKENDDVKAKRKSAKAGDGKITNLMSSDTDKILTSFRQSHYILSVPLLLILCSTLLIRTVGILPTLAGLLSLSSAVPLTSHFGKLIKKWRSGVVQKSDERVSKLKEALQGIRTLKIFTWEPFFESRIQDSRRGELEQLKGYLTSTIATQLIWRASPLVASAATFLVKAWVGGDELDAATAFTVLAMFNNVLRYPLFVVPKLVIAVMEMQVSLKRIQDFLEEADAERVYLSRAEGGGKDGDGEEATVSGDPGGCNTGFLKLGFSDRASFDYGPTKSSRSDETTCEGEAKPVLKDLDFEFPRSPGLFCVVGPTSSGKSSILLALLGELRTLKGTTRCSPLNPTSQQTIPPIAYVAQSPWLQNDTIRANILFNTPFDPVRYHQVIEACALQPDLDSFEAGDMTEVGESGKTLSGGQRSRVCLARAIYSSSPLLLLDDVLSAVDAHTARHILFKCLMGPLGKGRFIVLVTHAVELCLPFADFVVVMKHGGEVGAIGTLEEVLKKGEMEINVRTALIDAGVGGWDLETLTSKRQIVESGGGGGGLEVLAESSVEKMNEWKEEEKVKRVTKDESTGVGKVTSKVYKSYFDAAGGNWAAVLLVSSIALAYALGFAHDYAIKLWADKSKVSLTLAEPSQSSAILVLYASTVLLALGSLYARFMIQVTFSLRASAHMHSKALKALLKSPISFFDSTPSGVIVNRFGKDMQTVDQEVVGSIGETLQQAIHGLAVVSMIVTASPLLLLGGLPIAVVYMPIARKFMAITRSLKRLESVSRSPVFSCFGETLAGVVTIRAFRTEPAQLSNLFSKIDANHRAFLPLWASNRWLAFRVELVGAIVAFSVGVSIAASRKSDGSGLDPGWSGLCLTYAAMFTDVLTWLVRNSATMEMTMTSVERLDEYMDLEPEPSEEGGVENVMPSQWPSAGEIIVENLAVRYASNTPLALDLKETIKIKSGEKVAIVGRTGSGKSTLGAAFMRITEFERGTIFIDSVDISQMHLRDLRRGLTLVPQDAFLFQGSLRSNLDPLNQYTDALILETLSILGLESFDLAMPMSDSAISAGQRQLLSLGRAILKKIGCESLTGFGGKGGVLIMDEATASLDTQTEEVVQRALRNVFHSSGSSAPSRTGTDHSKWTVLTIAHRLRSVMDADRVLVMGDGHVLEDGSPRSLLHTRTGFFWNLCVESGELGELQRLAGL